MKLFSRKNYLLLITFFSGMAIMAMEIGASRLIAPYFGTSLFVWTNVIGVVLISLSIGYYIGGKLSDKRPDLQILLWLLCIAGLMFSVAPLLASPFAVAIKLTLFNISNASTMIMLGSFLLITILFALPLVLLGMVSPYVIRLYADSVEHLGEQAGSIFALSTMGSILGTFLPTLWLIPVIGTRWTMLLFSSLLILLAGGGLYRQKKYFILIVAFIAIASLSTFQLVSAQSIYSTESSYQHIEVLEDGDTRMLIFNEGLGIQSFYSHDDIFLGKYYDYYSPLPAFFEKDKVDIGIIGLAGGTISRMLATVYGDRISMDGVEIDSKVIDIAREYFELDQPQLNVINEDGRIFVERKKDAYDILIIDAYSQQLYIPWTMTTQEFWYDTKNSLHPGGIMALNMNATSPEAPLLSAVTNTIASVYDHVYVVPLTQNESLNYIVMASDEEVDFDSLSSDDTDGQLLEYVQVLQNENYEVFFDDQKIVLTDDRAPIELMTEEMLMEFFSSK